VGGFPGFHRFLHFFYLTEYGSNHAAEALEQVDALAFVKFFEKLPAKFQVFKFEVLEVCLLILHIGDKNKKTNQLGAKLLPFSFPNRSWVVLLFS
jgi:hypothetical protein